MPTERWLKVQTDLLFGVILWSVYSTYSSSNILCIVVCAFFKQIIHWLVASNKAKPANHRNAKYHYTLLSVMFNPLHSSTVQKYLCHHSMIPSLKEAITHYHQISTSAKMNRTQSRTLVSPWRVHCMYYGMPKVTFQVKISCYRFILLSVNRKFIEYFKIPKKLLWKCSECLFGLIVVFVGNAYSSVVLTMSH